MPAPTLVDTVFLDVVGTLIAPASTVGATYARIAGEHGVKISPEQTQHAFRRHFAGSAPPSYPGGIGSEEIDRAWWRTLVTAVIAEVADSPVSGDTLSTISTDLFEFYARPQAWRVFPEVPSVLAELSLRPLKLALISNFDARIYPVLEGLDLLHRLHAVIISSEAGATKPSPEIFTLALERAGTTPDRAIHAGDHPHADIFGASRAGIEAVLIERPRSSLQCLLHHPRIPRRP